MIQQSKIPVCINAHFNYILIFLIIFYTVGILGLVFPFSHSFFIRLTPVALLLSSTVVALFHSRFTLRTVFAFLFIYAGAFIVELIGVETGTIFGSYSYGKGLGPKLFNTPLIIGLNWLLLVYLANSTMQYIKLHIILKICGSALLLLCFDIILEQVAPKLDMWSFSQSPVPTRNYIVWFLLALFFSAVLSITKINTKNRIAPIVLGIQTLFFALLLLILN